MAETATDTENRAPEPDPVVEAALAEESRLMDAQMVRAQVQYLQGRVVQLAAENARLRETGGSQVEDDSGKLDAWEASDK